MEESEGSNDAMTLNEQKEVVAWQKGWGGQAPNEVGVAIFESGGQCRLIGTCIAM